MLSCASSSFLRDAEEDSAAWRDPACLFLHLMEDVWGLPDFDDCNKHSRTGLVEI